MLKIIASSNRRAVLRLLSPQRIADPSVNRRVARIVADVRRDGDPALVRYATTLDRLDGPMEVTRGEIEAAAAQVPASIRAAIRTAARNIRAIARRQVPRGWMARVAPGVAVEGRVVPLDRVGCYVPGGRYPLPSSMLMTAIPAAVAGVTDIVAVCPRPEPVVLAAAAEAGVSRLFRIGGAHAVAALAYGTRTVPRVDKIVGPGNRWVSAAKALVAADCGIDFYAGPTEIIIVSARGPAEWIAADLIAQAEHDPDARAVLITPDETLANEVAVQVERRAPHDGPARTALRAHGGIIVTPSMDDALALANDAAAEHLVVDDDASAERVRCAGSLFVGAWSAQVAGDYAIGSNHVLPTAGAARVRGGLSAADFVRQITVQRLTQDGLARIGPSVMALAQAEGLTSHAESISLRLRQSPRSGAARAPGAVRWRQDGNGAAAAGAMSDVGRRSRPVRARSGRR